MFRIYLRSPGGIVHADTKVATENRDQAVKAFEDLVNRTDLDGTGNAVALTFNHNQIAYHRFDRLPGQLDFWRNRMEELPLHIASGHKATSSGRSQFVTVRLDVSTVVRATEIGDGDLAAGLTLAVRQYQAPMLEILSTNEIRLNGNKTGLFVRQKGNKTVVYLPEAAKQNYTELPMPKQHYALWSDKTAGDMPSVEQFVEDLKAHLLAE